MNLRGKVFCQLDGAGIVTNDRYDFKGNLLSSTRQLLEDYKNDVNWSLSPKLEAAIYTSATTYDALNRPITLTTPDSSVARPRYNEANLLESLSVNLRGADEPTPFVTYINYNPKGQREIIKYGNGAHTRYNYDPLTFRLIRLLTSREQDRARLQDLNYVFDPVGNLTSIRDDAQETIYFRNHVVSPSNEYVYDATYRLICADGREHAGRPGQPQTTFDDSARMHEPLPSDGRALHRYREQYEYDSVGNILKLLHAASDGNWSRHYSYDQPHSHPRNNRLTSTRVGKEVEAYTYDPDGNMTRMPHLPGMDWDFKDQLHATRRQEMNAGRGETTYYVYNTAGHRVRKVTERASRSRKDERIYLGCFEVYREFDSVGATTLERQTLHVMEDKRCLVLIDTRTKGEEADVPERHIRYQYHNHLGSACLELDTVAAVITYEEYYPYGATSYQAGRNVTEAKLKRYRYTGKERDSENGLYYHGARYYSPWLGRWVSCDPLSASPGSGPLDGDPHESVSCDVGAKQEFQLGGSDGQSKDPSLQRLPVLNTYDGLKNNPVIYFDPDGRDVAYIAFPEYKPQTPIGKRFEMGHAGVLFIDNKTGATKYYEYGRYPSSQNATDPTQTKGLVRRVSVPDVVMKDGKPTDQSLQKVLQSLSRSSGEGGKVSAAYVPTNDNTRAAAYAEGRYKANTDNKREEYALILGPNNCATFARDTVFAETGKLFITINPSPNNVLDEFREEGFSIIQFDPKKANAPAAPAPPHVHERAPDHHQKQPHTTPSHGKPGPARSPRVLPGGRLPRAAPTLHLPQPQ